MKKVEKWKTAERGLIAYCHLFMQLGLVLLCLLFQLQLAVNRSVHGHGIVIELEADITAVAVAAEAVLHLKHGIVLLDVEHVAALLIKQGAQVALHVLVHAALVLMHDHDDAAFVLVGHRRQLVDDVLALDHVVVIVDQVGNAVDDDQVRTLVRDGIADDIITGGFRVTANACRQQACHPVVVVTAQGRHRIDGLLDTLGVAVRLLCVKEQCPPGLLQAAAIHEMVATHEDGSQDVAEEGLAVLPLGAHGHQIALGHRGHTTNLDEVVWFGILNVAFDEVRLHELVVLFIEYLFGREFYLTTNLVKDFSCVTTHGT